MTALDAAPAPAAKVPAPGRQRGLMPLLAVSNTLLFAVYGGAASILLPIQAKAIDPANPEAIVGLVSGIAAVFATLFNPIAGTLSDRTRSRWGRRNPYLVGGAVLTLVFLVLLGAAKTVVMLAIGWCLVQAAANVFQAAITAVIPDRVPTERRGVASAMMGMGMNVGILFGIFLMGRFTGQIQLGAIVLGGLLSVAAILMVTLTRDPRPDELPAEALAKKTSLADSFTAFLAALKNRDFTWVFAGRALITLGYFVINGYLFFILEKHVHMPKGMAPADGVALLLLVSTVGSVIATLIGGPLSDKLDRRKLFVLVSSLGAAVSLLIPLFSQSWTAMLVFAALNGLFFGVYMAVDTAIVTLVLPSQGDAARDMGVLNIANAGPQIVAPFVAATIISASGYSALYLVAAVFSLIGALSILPVKGVR